MKCPHLIKWLTFTCKAKEKPYSPSVFQVQEYCKGKYYNKCPFYSKNITAEDIDNLIASPHF